MKDSLKILFATDFSHSSKNSLKALKLFQDKFKTDITFVHAISSFWKDWISSGLYQKEATQRLESWQLELTGKTDKKKLFVKLGNPADTILYYSEAAKNDLIVLGSKNSDSKGRYKSGTTVENVVRNAKKSVLVCKNENVSKIICGIDGSPASEKALNHAIKLARNFNAELTILSVIAKVSENTLGMEEKDILKHEKKIEKNNEKIFKDIIKKHDLTGVTYSTQTKWGIPAHVLLDMAEDFDYNMIVVGAKGASKLQHVLMGSTAEKVLRFSPCSLLIVR